MLEFRPMPSSEFKDSAQRHGIVYGRNEWLEFPKVLEFELESPHLAEAKWFRKTPAGAILQAQQALFSSVPTVAREATVHSSEQKEKYLSAISLVRVAQPLRERIQLSLD